MTDDGPLIVVFSDLLTDGPDVRMDGYALRLAFRPPEALLILEVLEISRQPGTLRHVDGTEIGGRLDPGDRRMVLLVDVALSDGQSALTRSAAVVVLVQVTDRAAAIVLRLDRPPVPDLKNGLLVEMVRTHLTGLGALYSAQILVLGLGLGDATVRDEGGNVPALPLGEGRPSLPDRAAGGGTRDLQPCVLQDGPVELELVTGKDGRVFLPADADLHLREELVKLPALPLDIISHVVDSLQV
jgi:hypothetical protein